MTRPALEVVMQNDLSGELPHILDHEGNEIPCRETELRILRIAEGLRSLPGTRFSSPDISDRRLDATLVKVHDPEYLRGLQWLSEELGEEETVMFHPYLPAGIDADTPIVAGIYDVARDSARTAIAAADRIAEGAPFSYALCRPPGHHAGYGYLGGHCYLNNAVIALQALQDAGMKKLAVVDFDFHFGNGTSDLLARRKDISFGSVHSCTFISYPYRQTRPPHDRQCYIPLADDPGREGFLEAITRLMDHALRDAPEAIVVSVGYDIIAGDPFGKWDLPPDILEDVGRLLAGPGVPLCMVQEGGYLPEHLDECSYRFGIGLHPQPRMAANLGSRGRRSSEWHRIEHSEIFTNNNRE